MKKLSKKEVAKTTYDKLQSKRKWIKRRSIILALFVFGVNIYAWFIYMANAKLEVNANIVSWDVNFFDENSEIKDVAIIPNDLFPGMSEYDKTIIVKNTSELKAVFDYEIKNLKILGEDAAPVGASHDDINNILANDYPFKIDINTDKLTLSEKDQLNFNVSISWDYDAGSDLYYKVSSLYSYDESIDYYSYDGENYNKDATVTKDNFTTKINDGIYVEKDDADSFFGQACQNYKESTGKTCVSFDLKLSVTQKS